MPRVLCSWALCALLASCLLPPFDSLGPGACNESHACPSGYACVDGLCTQGDGGVTDAGTDSGMDSGSEPPVDSGVPWPGLSGGTWAVDAGGDCVAGWCWVNPLPVGGALRGPAMIRADEGVFVQQAMPVAYWLKAGVIRKIGLPEPMLDAIALGDDVWMLGRSSSTLYVLNDGGITGHVDAGFPWSTFSISRDGGVWAAGGGRAGVLTGSGWTTVPISGTRPSIGALGADQALLAVLFGGQWSLYNLSPTQVTPHGVVPGAMFSDTPEVSARAPDAVAVGGYVQTGDGGWRLILDGGIPRASQDGTLAIYANGEVRTVRGGIDGAAWSLPMGTPYVQAEVLAGTGLCAGDNYAAWLGPGGKYWLATHDSLRPFGIDKLVLNDRFITLSSDALTYGFDGGLTPLFGFAMDQLIIRPSGEQLSWDGYGTLQRLSPAVQPISAPGGDIWAGITVSPEGTIWLATDSVMGHVPVVWTFTDAGIADAGSFAGQFIFESAPLDARHDNDVLFVSQLAINRRVAGVWSAPLTAPDNNVSSACSRSANEILVGAQRGLWEYDAGSWFLRADGGSSTVSCGGGEAWAISGLQLVHSTAPGAPWVDAAPPATPQRLVRLRTGDVYFYGSDQSSLVRWGGP